MRFDNKNVILPEPWIQPGPPNDEIWYTTTDGNIVTPNRPSSLPTIVSNTYVDGKGVIKFATNVTSIEWEAFQDCTSLISITIGNGVISIGDAAFNGCSGLTSISIPNSVTSIGQNTFANCTGFTSIIIPDSVTSIGSSFWNCNRLTSVTIPNSVKSIGADAFNRCWSLTTISYTGTIAQYNAITKGANWHKYVPATVVHCTDGDAPI